MENVEWRNTICGYRITVLPQVSNLLTGVRLPLPAQRQQKFPAPAGNFCVLGAERVRGVGRGDGSEGADCPFGGGELLRTVGSQGASHTASDI